MFGWLSVGRLAEKIAKPFKRLGTKIGDGFRAGLKFVRDNVGKVKNVVGKVGDIAGTVGNVAGTISPFAAMIPGVGTAVAGGLAGLSALGKTVEAGAEAGERGLGRVEQLEQRGRKALARGEALASKGSAILDRLGK